MIREPNIVKGIPALIVRVLPILYYYGRFAPEKVPLKPLSIYHNHVKYLKKSLKEMTNLVKDERLIQLQTEIDSLKKLTSDQIEAKVYDFTRSLSEICLTNSDALKHGMDGSDGLKKSLLDLFCDIIQKTKVLIIDNSDQPDWVENLGNKLAAICYYDVTKTRMGVEQFSDKLVNNDFVVFASATPQTIHEDVEILKTYKKPGLVLGSIQKDIKLDQQTIRNGSWLRNRGYDVLFKLFSPIRLFTTIDKIYIRYLLQSA